MKEKLYIEGMNCMHCVKRVQNALKEVDGVTEATVDLKGKFAVVILEKTVSDKLLKNSVKEAGYEITDIEML